MVNSYPSLSWIKSQLRNSVVYPLRKKVLAAYIIGSEAKGSTRKESDLDIAIVIAPVRGKTSLKLTELYHQKFSNDSFKPLWENRLIDFQFFYADSEELEEYQKIEIF